MRRLYRIRQEVEEVIRVVEKTTHSQPQAQTHHLALGRVAYLIIERERFDPGMTWQPVSLDHATDTEPLGLLGSYVFGVCRPHYYA